MCEELGNELPFYIGHVYNLTISRKAAAQMEKDYHGSKFYAAFKDNSAVFNARPWDIYLNNEKKRIAHDDIDLKLYGLATMYEHI